jgi:parallel beta-helix repeat protein
MVCRSVCGAAETLTPTSGVKIDHGTALKPGVYHLADPGGGTVQVSGENFILDCKGARLVGPGTGEGVGIHITDARNVTIKNADVTGWLWGIVIERSVSVKLLDCNVSHNADLPPGTVIDESGQGPEDNHGGGIVLRDCRDCRALRCTAQHQWDGIDVVRSTGCIIEDGDYSYNGNWGVHLWDSSRNTFRRNRAVWCTTGSGTLYQALSGWQTYDAQAVGIDHNSNENLIADNDLRFGGDGIFIRANEGPIAPGMVVPPRNGSHRNILLDNDCSFSPNNAIEVDLVDDTIISGNNCSYSNYGMWLGYSRRCVVTNNTCINDASHAVEIENGQDDIFTNNVFGYDRPRPEDSLVYLRQNGRDATPSGPYRFVGNNFYGTRQGVRLKGTACTLDGDTISWSGAGVAQIVTGDAASAFKAEHVVKSADITSRSDNFVQTPPGLEPGRQMRLSGVLPAGKRLPVVEIDGIPAWVKSWKGGDLIFQMPDDFWDRPAKERVAVHILGASGWSEYESRVRWLSDRPRVDSVTPNPARVGDTVTITGANLGKTVLFNNRPAEVVTANQTKLIVKLPKGVIVSTGYNLIVQRPVGETLQSSWPITFRVVVPDEQMPHLIAAGFSPTTLKVGELLHITFTVRNNLPTPVALLPNPSASTVYEENQTWSDIGVKEEPNTIHLRVTSDHPGSHDPGSWPWIFGFEQKMLAPGETTTVTGAIRVATAGDHEFRVGLVATGSRFIDDNAYRTRIMVMPK